MVSRIVILGILASSVFVATMANQTAGDEAPDPCVTINVLESLDEATIRIRELVTDMTDSNEDDSWLSNVRVCPAGKYDVWIPADGQSAAVWIVSRDGLGIQLGDEELLVLEGGGRRVVGSFGDTDSDGVVDFVRYEARPRELPGEVEVWDRDGDGCTDWTVTRKPGEEGIYSFKFGGKWYELSREHGHACLRVGDECHPFPESRAVAIEDALRECKETNRDDDG